MTEPSDPVPTTQASTPASSAPEQGQPATENSQTLPIRNSKPTKPTEDAPASTDGATEKSLSPAELKKKAKAEKAARRIREKLEKEGGAPSSTTPIPSAGVQARPPTTPKKDATGPGSAQKGPRAPPPRRGSGPIAQTGSVLVEQKKKKDDKKVAIFGHLYGQQRRVTVAGATKEVHHAILALGMQLMDYTICGSSARCVATLLAFKRVCCCFVSSRQDMPMYTDKSLSKGH
jgi:translation initiation factor eIF-2B subunit delta